MENFGDSHVASTSCNGRARHYYLAGGLLVAVLVAVADYVTGDEIAMSIFYLVAVALVAWGMGLRWGIFFSVLCSVLWFNMDNIGGLHYSSLWISYWNGIVRLLIFLAIAVLLPNLRNALSNANAARDAALQATRVKSSFLANMSHEIRTPMNAILGTADLLAETGLSKEQRNYVEIFRREGRRLLDLINDLLDLSKVEAGKYTPERIGFEVHRLIEEIVSLVAVQAVEKGLRFHHEFHPETPRRIVGDPTLLRRIILNLISNAVKFTSTGSVTLRVKPTSSDQLQFTVEDTGPGIEPGQLSRLFDPFQQADASITRRFGGTGLGLSLARGFVERLGGRIRVESEAGRGSAFHFTLPIELAPEDSVMTHGASQPVTMTTDTRPLRILLVEDYEINRQIIRAYCKDTAYLFEEAANGEEALLKFQNRIFDIVLLDVQMPVMDGHTAARAMRSWERERGLPPTPIVALTAHAYEEDRQKSLDAGCTAHLSKPVEKETLLRTIVAHTADRDVAQALAIPPTKTRVIDPDIRNLLPTFLRGLQEASIAAAQAFEGADLNAVADSGHRIKGTGAVFGFPEISELGAQLEVAASKGRGDDVRRLLAELTAAVQKVEVDIGSI